ncbi:nucleoside 2-deoxyribosyltransferase [Methylocella sp.]|uniref:nucleoside 2-deoxyribosyltransferase n=1 Tax=Methylocella sp. TaxID=1978226 RepID=UPI0035B0E5B8
MADARPRLYLAGPDIFLPNADEIARAKRELCARFGFAALHPFDNELHAAAPDAAARVYRANLALLRRADGGIFNLTPFRSLSADVGTVFELGFLAALERPVFGYGACASTLLERARAADACARFDADDRCWRDGEGLRIEDFGRADNLMIDECLAASGGFARKAADDESHDDLAGFARALEAARAHFGR